MDLGREDFELFKSRVHRCRSVALKACISRHNCSFFVKDIYNMNSKDDLLPISGNLLFLLSKGSIGSIWKYYGAPFIRGVPHYRSVVKEASERTMEMYYGRK